MPKRTINHRQFTATAETHIWAKPALDSYFNNKDGFTLVELIVVVAIIGILATLSVTAFTQYKESTQNKAVIADIRTLDKAVMAYMIDKLVPPPSLSDVNMETSRDPWKKPFGYGRHGDAGVVPLEYSSGGELNDDYDLYSKGKDGVSSEIFDPATCEDDFVRANNGAYVGER